MRPGPRQAVDWELLHHIEERTDRLVAQGWDAHSARGEAERLFGDEVRIRRELYGIARTREGRMTMRRWVDALVQDVALALRNMRHAPGFAVALVLTLGLGIGANSAIFSVVDALLVRPLPYRGADRIVEVGLRLDGGFTLPWINADQVEPLRSAAQHFEASAVHGSADAVRTDQDEPENVRVLAASHELDDFLGAPVQVGRGFAADDAVPGAPKVAILTQAYWREHGSDPDAVGSDLRLDGELHTVVGLLAPGFRFPVPGSHEVWVPLATDQTALDRPVGRIQLVGRLSEGLALEDAQARADATAAALDESAPHRMGWTTQLTPVDSWRANPDVRRGSLMLAGAVVLILVIALVNGINLMLVRGASRTREMGIRTAIGASAGRLMRQIVTESLVMASLAGAVAVGLALAGSAAAQGLMPGELRWSSFHDFGVEGRTLAFTFVVTWTIGLLLGILPAAQAARHGRRLAGGAEAISGRGPRAFQAEHLLVCVEVALSVALLVGAGLFVNSFTRLLSTDPGFDAESLLVVDVSLSEARYGTSADRALFFNRFTERLGARPGVEAVSRADGVPPGTGFSYGVALQTVGGSPPPGQPEWLPTASGDAAYLDVLGTELLAGRRLTAADAELDNVLIDRPLADFLWPDGDPLGQAFRLDEDGRPYTVVGVTEDVKFMGVDDRRGRFDAFFALPDSTARAFGSVAIRTREDPERMIPEVRRVLYELDPEQAISDIQTGRQAMAGTLEKHRFLMSAMGLVAALAALLSIVGIFGVTAYVVGQRTKEIGIRIALGAPTGRVRREVRARSLVWASVGVGVGLGIAAALDGTARELLYGVEPGDPVTYAVVAALMMLAALVGADIPARRAPGAEPSTVLRTE